MKLKCIGGLFNNQYHQVQDNLKIGDAIRKIEEPKFEITSFEESLQAFRENRTPSSIVLKYHYYIIDHIKIADTSYGIVEIKFLRYEDKTFLEIFEFLLK